MKKLLIIFTIMLSVNCHAQNRFDKMFAQADSSFRAESDSAKFNRILKEIESNKEKVTISVEQLLLVYMNGYINGSLNYKNAKKFDFDILLMEIKVNKRSILSSSRFIRKEEQR